MKIKKLLAAVLCCVLLSSCSGMSLTGSDVLSPPMAQGTRSELQELIKDLSGGSYSLIYPSSGESQNAVIFRDIDGDGAEEAVAMYRAANGGARVLFARADGSGYASAGETEVSGPLIERVDFADVDNDGREEFILTYPDASSPQFSLAVVSLGDELKRSDMPACCNTFVIGDFDADPADDVMLLSLAGISGTASAKLLSFEGGVISVKASCEMDSQLSGYSKITCGGICDGVKGAVVDGCTPSGEYTTQILYYDEASAGLMNPLFIYMGYESTRRTSVLSSSDVDRDGLIEIPICSLCAHSADENAANVCRTVSWNSFNASEVSLTRKKTAVLCDNEGFLFNIGDSRADKVTARRTEEGAVEFYGWGEVDGTPQRTDLLLTVKRYPRSSFDRTRVLEAVLGETADSIYTYIINQVDSELCYSDEEVAGSFVPIDHN